MAGELKCAPEADAREELELAKDNQNRVSDGKAQLSDPTRKLLRELGEKGVQARAGVRPACASPIPNGNPSSNPTWAATWKRYWSTMARKKQPLVSTVV